MYRYPELYQLYFTASTLRNQRKKRKWSRTHLHFSLPDLQFFLWLRNPLAYPPPKLARPRHIKTTYTLYCNSSAASPTRACMEPQPPALRVPLGRQILTADAIPQLVPVAGSKNMGCLGVCLASQTRVIGHLLFALILINEFESKSAQLMGSSGYSGSLSRPKGRLEAQRSFWILLKANALSHDFLPHPDPHSARQVLGSWHVLVVEPTAFTSAGKKWHLTWGPTGAPPFSNSLPRAEFSFTSS
jgi:hypothetical protein